MPSLQRQAAEVLYDDELGERFVDLRIDLREWGDSRTSILEVGGRWDRQERRWDSDGERRIVWRVHPGQYEAAYFFRDWFNAKVEGRRVPGWEEVYVMLGAGGRGAGKSDFGVRAGVMVAAGMADQIAWFVSPVEDETQELQRSIETITPASFYVWLKSDLCYYFWNGSRISMMSGYSPGTLKRGRVDYWLLNEAQRFPLESYKMIRPRLADTSGLGYIAANPPRDPKGRWVMDFFDRSKAKKLPGIRLFEFDPKLNPTIDHRGLEVLRPEFGEEDYRREILGEMLPIGDLVFYAWSDLLEEGNVRRLPDVGDCTRAITRKHLGREFDYVFGVDLQLTPHMASTPGKFFADPDDKERPLFWYTHNLAVVGTEDDLVDAWEAAGFDPDRCALIIDASGWWQDAERTKGKASVDVFKRRGWRWCFRPDKKLKKNPPVSERIMAMNARLCAAGKRRTFSVPENLELNQALKMWENRNGQPNKRSDFAHYGDASSYVQIRFFPRRFKKVGFEYHGGARVKSDYERELDDAV